MNHCDTHDLADVLIGQPATQNWAVRSGLHSLPITMTENSCRTTGRDPRYAYCSADPRNQPFKNMINIIRILTMSLFAEIYNILSSLSLKCFKVTRRTLQKTLCSVEFRNVGRAIVEDRARSRSFCPLDLEDIFMRDASRDALEFAHVRR